MNGLCVSLSPGAPSQITTAVQLVAILPRLLGLLPSELIPQGKWFILMILFSFAFIIRVQINFVS